MNLHYTDDVISLLAEKGYDANYGARPLRRTIQRTVEDALSESIIAGKLALGDEVELYVSNEHDIAFRKHEETKKPKKARKPKAKKE